MSFQNRQCFAWNDADKTANSQERKRTAEQQPQQPYVPDGASSQSQQVPPPSIKPKIVVSPTQRFTKIGVDRPAEPMPLREVLQSVRPDWTAKDLNSVQEKLLKININTPQELFALLQREGVQSVNIKLKNAGQKVLKA